MRRDQPTPADLDRIRDIYERGYYLRAFEASRHFAPLAEWQTTAARVLASRLASHLGAVQLGTRLAFCAFRHDPLDPDARYYYAHALSRLRGPIALSEFLARTGESPHATVEQRADWLSLHTLAAAGVRDFEAARAAMARAEELHPSDPFRAVERAYLLRHQDRYEESLAAARRSLEMRPWYRPGVQATAEALLLLDRGAEALELLRAAAERIESYAVVADLALLEDDLGLHAEARQSLERVVQLAPLAEPELRRWLDGLRADAAHACGNLATASQRLRAVGEPLLLAIADRLDAATEDSDRRRVKLDVRFVRQHHQTCVPATLSALSHFFALPADHVQVAESICWDGTPAHSERRWAEEHGFATREFAFSWDSAVALLERGVPFVLSTHTATTAHAQAVIGFDALRRTLYLRDSNVPRVLEADAERLIAAQRATGPRCLVLVPRDRSHLLDDIELPDARLYDHLHLLARALDEHDRDAALAELSALETKAPEHPLSHRAGWALAAYDQDPAATLAHAEQLLARFPDDPFLLSRKVALLRDVARRSERIELLERIGRDRSADPVFLRQLAGELLTDARQHDRARRLLRRALRRDPLSADTVHGLADLDRAQLRGDEALRLYRLATCLEDTAEGHAAAYFAASRELRRTDEGLDLLRRRAAASHGRTSAPARTLFTALTELERDNEALVVLEGALAERPGDGELLLFAALARARRGDLDAAAELAARAEACSHRGTWLGVAAELARRRGDLDRALVLAREAAAAAPLEVSAHQAVAELLEATSGRAAAVAHMEQAARRFPHFLPLAQAWCEALRNDHPAAREAALRSVIERHPHDSWVHRELGFLLVGAGRLEEARATAETALRLAPEVAASHMLAGQIETAAGNPELARACFRRALQIEANFRHAIDELLAACPSRALRHAELAFVLGEILRQPCSGDGLLAYRDAARGWIGPEELLANLRDALAARPDLASASSAVVLQMMDTGRTTAALDLARKTSVRNPHRPQAWLDLAIVCRAAREPVLRRRALEQALTFAPSRPVALRWLADLEEEEGNLDGARATLDRAIAEEPLVAASHGRLSELLWRQKQPEAAVAAMRRALDLNGDPAWPWALETLAHWGQQRGDPGLATRIARERATGRPDDPRAWLALARTLDAADQIEDRLEALRRTLELDPRRADAHDLRAATLAEAGRYDEALAACAPEALGQRVPFELRGRAAWVEAQRGHREQAVERMQEVLRDEPEYVWGFWWLEHWASDLGRNDLRREAAQALVRLVPLDPNAHVALGETLAFADEREAARSAFRRALELEPSHYAAGLELFDLELKAGDLDAAGRALAALPPERRDAYALAREVILAARRGDREAARTHIEALAAMPQHGADWPLDTAIAAMDGNTWAADVDSALAAAQARPDPAREVVAAWVRRGVLRGTPRRIRTQLAGFRARGEIGVAADEAYLLAMSEIRRVWRLRWHIFRESTALRRHTCLWGQVGYVYTAMAEHTRVIAWLADWRERPDVEPWMLFNLAMALRRRGHDVRAGDVHRAALGLAADASSARHAAWLAADMAASFRDGEARGLLGAAAAGQLPARDRFVRDLAVTMLAAGSDGPSFAEARRLLAEAVERESPRFTDDAPLLRVWRRALRRIARARGGVRAAIWRASHWLPLR